VLLASIYSNIMWLDLIFSYALWNCIWEMRVLYLGSDTANSDRLLVFFFLPSVQECAGVLPDYVMTACLRLLLSLKYAPCHQHFIVCDSSSIVK
jgi:hypothetical protein